jgi:hypothetical protein
VSGSKRDVQCVCVRRIHVQRVYVECICVQCIYVQRVRVTIDYQSGAKTFKSGVEWKVIIESP